MPKQQNLKIIPLGGLGEVGRNMMLITYQSFASQNLGRRQRGGSRPNFSEKNLSGQEKILIIDMGFRLPEEDMPGVDFIIPNISYLKNKTKNVLGIVFTHGHYDHIGAIPYLIEKFGNLHPGAWPKANAIGLPIFASALTKGIILKRQEDFPKLPKLNIKTVKDGSVIKLGHFKIEFFRQNHNIPDNLGVFVQTPIGNILHTSDFKFDKTPINDLPTNFRKLNSFGKQGILLLMSDSTYAETEGYSLSEKDIKKNLEEIFRQAKGRIIAATFSSLLNRIQQMIDLSEKYNRKVVIEGFSMRANVDIAKNLGYLKTKKSTIIKAKNLVNYPGEKITILCTGAQGEERAALMRIANKEHKFIRLHKNDTVLLSSSVIPGNERTVQAVKDDILRQGAKVFHYKMMDIHAGGHAQKEELKEMLKIIKPKFFLPIHGQYSMLAAHKEIAQETGLKEKNIVLAENGQIINLTPKNISLEKKEVPSNYVMVDGLGIGDVGEIVLRDRQNLAQDGMFVIAVVIDHKTGKVIGSPDIISRGFVYLRESKKLLEDTRKKVIKIVNKSTGSGKAINWTYIKNNIRDKIGDFLYTKTERRPMVLPVIIEV